LPVALSSIMMLALCERLKPGARIASLGYPDIIAPLDVLENIIGETGVRSLDFMPDSARICKRHGMNYRGIPDAQAFFRGRGAELTVYDIVQERGCERLADLNVPQEWDKEYDFVLDVGTLEHCFNIGTAAINAVYLLKEGGIILHENPFNWGNHGFYGLNPTWYADFYGQPGLKLLQCKMVTRNGAVGDPPQTARFPCVEEEVNVFAVAQRTGMGSIGWPVQTKYAKLIGEQHGRKTANA